jgi:NAD(P)-dependent dehydrogenase (short-subunit alcohol dehydrogenase family)
MAMAEIENWTDRVAVVTGGGNGIGAALCRRFAAEGMRVVVADVEEASAQKVATELNDAGAKAIGVACDVSQRSAIEALAQQTLDGFGRVDVVCNNAGVFLGGAMRDFTPEDWNWILSVNLMGVVHGSSVFAPLLVEQGEGHILNTASIGGFASDPSCVPYTTSKFAVVGYSEALRNDLEADGVGVSILCPGPVASRINEGDRLRPARTGDSRASASAADRIVAVGMPPDEVAERALDGIRKNAIYIFTHPELGGIFEPRIEAMRKALAETPEPRSGPVDTEDLL